MSRGRIPNIFIKEINLFDATSDQMTAKVTTVIGDTKDSNSWSSNEVSEHMRVLVVISANSDLNSNITEGRTNFDKDLLMSEYLGDERVKIFSRPAKSFMKIDSPDNVRYLDSYEAEFNNNENEIRVFCGVYLEMSEILQKSNLDFAGPVRRYGSVSSDFIIQFGSPVTTATIFTLPNGQQYVGPVHFNPEKGYMVGPRHIEGEHEVLTNLEVTNYKLKDFRKNNFTSPQAIGNQNTATYSNLNYSINREGNATGVFSINFRNLVLYETKYGYFLRTLSNEAILENINNIKIKNLQVMRRRVDVDESAIVVKSYAINNGSPIESINTDAGSMSEIEINQDNIRTFQFVDKTINKTSLGKYQYHLSLSFTDPTVEFISGIINDLRTSEKAINDYYRMVEKHKNYDFELDRTKSRLYNSEFNDFNINNFDNPSWSVANEVYVRTSSYLYNLTNLQKRNLSIAISTKVDPRNATLFSLRSFNEDLTTLKNDFERLFDLSNNNTQADSREVFVKTANSRNVIFLDHLFNNSFMAQNYFISYDYMDMNTGEGVAILTKDAFESRANDEFNKFFNAFPSDKQSEFIPKGYEALLNLQENLYSYMSPRMMILGQDSVDLKDVSKVKIEEVNKLFNPSFDRNIYNLGKTKKKDLQNVSEEMSKPKVIKDEESNNAR